MQKPWTSANRKQTRELIATHLFQWLPQREFQGRAPSTFRAVQVVGDRQCRAGRPLSAHGQLTGCVCTGVSFTGEGSQGPGTGQCSTRSRHNIRLLGVPGMCLNPKPNLHRCAYFSLSLVWGAPNPQTDYAIANSVFNTGSLWELLQLFSNMSFPW